MKKLSLILLFISTFSVCVGQNTGIDISFLHNPEGKIWKRYNSPDGQPIHPSELESQYIFKSDGNFIFKESNNSNSRVLPSTSKRWAYNETNNVLSWDITLANGMTKKFRAELTYIDQVRMVTNLSENGNEPTIVIYIVD